MIQIREDIWIGKYSDPRDAKELKNADVTVIFNVAAEVNAFVETAPQRYIKVGLTDDSHNPPHIKDLAVITLKKLLVNGERVLVHCGAGQSRSVWVATIAIAQLEEKHPNDVFAEIKRLHPFAVKGPLWGDEWKKYYS